MKEYLECFSIVIASFTAIYGIRAWRREMRGKREYELAEEVLSLFYEAQDKIRYIRSPMGWMGEGQSRKANQNESLEEKHILDQAYVTFERYEKNQQVFNRLHALRYRFMVVFGSDKTKPFDELRIILNEIFIASHAWASTKKRFRTAPEQKQEKLDEDINKYEAVFWEGFENDTITLKLDKTVKDAEEICRKIIQPRLSWLSKIKLNIVNWFKKTRN